MQTKDKGTRRRTKACMIAILEDDFQKELSSKEEKIRERMERKKS